MNVRSAAITQLSARAVCAICNAFKPLPPAEGKHLAQSVYNISPRPVLNYRPALQAAHAERLPDLTTAVALALRKTSQAALCSECRPWKIALQTNMCMRGQTQTSLLCTPMSWFPGLDLPNPRPSQQACCSLGVKARLSAGRPWLWPQQAGHLHLPLGCSQARPWPQPAALVLGS